MIQMLKSLKVVPIRALIVLTKTEMGHLQPQIVVPLNPALQAGELGREIVMP